EPLPPPPPPAARRAACGGPLLPPVRAAAAPARGPAAGRRHALRRRPPRRRQAPRDPQPLLPPPRLRPLPAVAFVSFFTHHAALAAMASLNGSVFDPDNGDCLHIELAKSNSRKRHGGGGEVYRVIDKRVRTEENSDNDNNRDEGDDDVSGNDDGQDGSDGPSDEENDNSSDKNELPTDQSGEPGIKQQKGRSSSNDQPDKIPPCSTLFLSNLGQTCTEKELEELLSKQPGFHVLKMRRRGGLPAAFADFTDIESSAAAMENLKGTILSSSDSDGLQIEYARSKMRKS
ncbi:hypothetical protein CFC21_100978, partial [Triticum aestivum]